MQADNRSSEPTENGGAKAHGLRNSVVSLLRSPRLLLAVGLALGVLASVILIGKEHLRQNVREQITHRDAEILYAVALMHRQDPSEEVALNLDDPFEQFSLMLEISRLKGVIAVRLYDPEGKSIDVFPPYVLDGEDVPAEQLALLQELKPVSAFHEQVPLDSILADGHDHGSAPLLEILVPLHSPEQSRLAGIGQFIIEGRSVASEYAALDRHLNTQAGLAFLSGGAILVLGLGMAFHRLERTNRLLEARTESLLQANEELVLTAKTAAVGTVTSHLLHGLKNPLAGLEDFVCTRGEGQEGSARWEQAEAAANRMRTMIQDILGLLRDEDGFDSCDLSLADLGSMVLTKVQPLGQEHGVQFQMNLRSEHQLPSRVAQVTSLILANLIQNAMEATPAGGLVELNALETPKGLSFEVRDQGPGIPQELAPRLFTPGRSTKPNGSGLGLALCKQMAKQIGADLTLKESTGSGATFALMLPQKVLSAVCAS
jgi:signal transduction histidine kinase